MKWLIGLMSALLLTATAPASAHVVRHSGTITSVDRAGGVLVVATLEEGRRDGSLPSPTSVRVVVTPSTEVVEARRGPGSAIPDGDFLDLPAPASRLTPGTFVTAEGERQGDRLVADTITIVVPTVR
jgi:hypothetical protein